MRCVDWARGFVEWVLLTFGFWRLLALGAVLYSLCIVQTVCLHAIDKLFGITIFGGLSWPSLSCLLWGVVQPAIGSFMGGAFAGGWPSSFPFATGSNPIEDFVPLAVADSIPLDVVSFPLQERMCKAMTALACALQVGRMVKER